MREARADGRFAPVVRGLLIGAAVAVLTVAPPDAFGAASWTEREVGQTPPGLPFGESFSLTPDGLGILSVAVTSPTAPVTLVASTVVGGVPGPLTPLGGLPAAGPSILLAAGRGRMALVVTHQQAKAQRVLIARGPVGGAPGPVSLLLEARGRARIGRPVTNARGDVAIPYATGSALRLAVAHADGTIRRHTLAHGSFLVQAAALSTSGELVVVGARVRARGIDFLARRVRADGRSGRLERLDRIRAVDAEPALDVAMAGGRAVAAWRVAACGEEGCGPATARAALLGAPRPSTLTRGRGRRGPDGGTPRVTVSATGRATVVWTDRTGRLRAADLRMRGRARSTVISDPGPPAQPLAIQPTPTGELIVLSVRGACPCPSPWTLQATLRSPNGSFSAPERVAAGALTNPYAWLAIDPSRRLALAAYDLTDQRPTVASRPY
jgi:hypothetical protein